MKTTLQEHIEWLEESHKHFSSQWEMDIAAGLRYAIENAEAMLEKEREIICNAFSDARHGAVESRWTAEEYFEETFNTKER